MADAGRDDVERALDAALAALARCHEAGRAAGLGKGAATLGAATDWRATFATMPGRIGDATGVAPPAIDSARLADGVLPRTVAFVKWDARPGNAIVRDTGRVAWFDWEHAGVRSPLDDVAWLLGDEYVGDLPGIEHALLARHLAAFAGDLDDDAARDYLMTVLCLHACVRLALILSYRLRDGRWWDRRQTIREDRVGVDIGYALTLCAKAGRWARETRLTRPLSPWFADVAERIRANG
jgi:hypothetical protein